jgi:hypothetical protein
MCTKYSSIRKPTVPSLPLSSPVLTLPTALLKKKKKKKKKNFEFEKALNWVKQ